jgi:hypothetical protein
MSITGQTIDNPTLLLDARLGLPKSAPRDLQGRFT